ncbi:trimeric intracellular cation channel family protein [Luteimonas aestuarii]|uniref:Trimeric intracellular cation channel family protein n=1 Tax=Luteimonas aestuarii TaxID=453837 RepID=A0A4R5U4H7_9GAMM|nr:trimeric intracellular cation channel family protein [Luteimonas aestuarii]TDK28651.1 trimeric intracellular cation channel family protein [Luteimonas aestuarii]
MALHIAYLVAIVAEAMSAALVAGRREMDWFGVCVIACVTALGGGTVRDVLLGHHPLAWVQHPEYLAYTLTAALSVGLLAPLVLRLRRLFLLLDAVGLVVFTVIGCNVASELSMPFAIVLVSGMITGTCGGMLRDVLCGQTPLLFRKELYASISLTTGLLYMGGQDIGLQHDLAMILSMIAGFTFRILAIRYDWNMPRFVYRGDWS